MLNLRGCKGYIGTAGVVGLLFATPVGCGDSGCGDSDSGHGGSDGNGGDGGSSNSQQVVGVTATQVVLSYEAPDSKACRLEVSESSSYAPLVHDVDPALFTGADSDGRAGNITAGTSRVVVIGKRLSDSHALDGNTYSRALQTNTKHYFRISCGTNQTTGTFVTANIPLGMTYNDVPQPDADHPGQWTIPTLIQDRNQSIIDPQTGALLKRVSLDAEKVNPAYYNGAFLTYGGFNRVCSPTPAGPTGGPQGFLCSLMDYNGGPNLLYFIIPTTGEVRYLGSLPYGAKVNGADLSFYTTGSDGSVYKVPYTGGFAPATGNAPTGDPVLYSSVATSELMKTFDPTFDPTLFGCGNAVAGPGDYALIVCGRSIQDSYGWLGVLYGGDGRPLITANCAPSDTGCPRVVGAMNVVSAPETRWCSLHNVQMVPDNPLVSINFQELKDFSGGLGVAPMATTLVSNIDATQTSITVAGEPQSLATAGDPFHQNAAVGDSFYIGKGPTETVQITGITMQGTQRVWQISRTSGQAFPAGTVVWAACKAGFRMGYWKFLNDPHGTDTTNANVVIDQYWDGGGHWDSGPLGRITEHDSGWAAVLGKVIDHLNEPLSLQIDDSPTFAGTKGLDYGSTTSKHPSYHQVAALTSAVDQQWFVDMMPFDGGNLFSDNPGATLVSGQLYKYLHAALSRKQLPTLAASGGRALIDKSGSGSVISDQSSDAFTYCIANVAGECRVDSAAGDIYINAPDVQNLYCAGSDGPVPTNHDLCIGNAGAYVQSMAQIYLGKDSAESAAHSRTITHGLAGIRDMFYYSTGKSLPDASWALFNQGLVIAGLGDTVNVWMAKIPPLVAQDTLDRSTFLPLSLNLTPPPGIDAGSIDNVVVQFGYEEQGAPDQYFCTSRREACEAASTSIDAKNPFYFRSEPHDGVPCAKGTCTVAIPVLPMHTAHFKVLFRDKSNATLGYAQGLSAEIAGKMLAGGS